MLTLIGNEKLETLRKEHDSKFPPKCTFLYCAIKYDIDQKFYFITVENDEKDIDYKIEDNGYHYEVGDMALFKINNSNEMAYFSDLNEQSEYSKVN